MTRVYVKGHYVPGICDRCGHEKLLRELVSETIQGRLVNNRVCDECFDVDHPQNFLSEVRIVDPQNVYDPRTDSVEFDQMRSLNGFQPVGNPATLISAKQGQANVRY
jgi:hypothetical protein